jgi:hypothetical protein
VHTRAAVVGDGQDAARVDRGVHRHGTGRVRGQPGEGRRGRQVEAARDRDGGADADVATGLQAEVVAAGRGDRAGDADVGRGLQDHVAGSQLRHDRAGGDEAGGAGEVVERQARCHQIVAGGAVAIEVRPGGLDDDVLRVEPQGARETQRRTAIGLPAEVQAGLARDLDQPAVAAAGAAAGVGLPGEARDFVGPDDHPPGVAALGGAGVEHGAAQHRHAARVAHGRVVALEVATHQHLAAAGAGAGIQPGTAVDQHAVALHQHLAAAGFGRRAAGVQRAGDVGDALGPAVDDDAALALGEAGGPHDAREVEHRLGHAGPRRGAQLDTAAGGVQIAEHLQACGQLLVGLDVEQDQAVALDVDAHRAGRGQRDARRLDAPGLQQLRCDQRNAAAGGADQPFAAQLAALVAACRVAEHETAGGDVALRQRAAWVALQAERAGHQAADVDARVAPEDDATGVDQPHAAVAAELAEQMRRIGAGHAVEQHGVAPGLQHLHGLAGGDRKARPVQPGLRRLLVDLHLARRSDLHLCAAEGRHRAFGQGVCAHGGQGQRRGQAHGARPELGQGANDGPDAAPPAGPMAGGAGDSRGAARAPEVS